MGNVCFEYLKYLSVNCNKNLTYNTEYNYVYFCTATNLNPVTSTSTDASGKKYFSD